MRRLLLRVTRHGRMLNRGVSGHAAAELVERAVARAGLDPAAGLLVSPKGDVARHSRHKSIAMLRQYVREQSLSGATLPVLFSETCRRPAGHADRLRLAV